ncbi:hypothetical protein [Alcanivorax sp.]|uniref:hypothetical protein n=1 Tax=Alcanivorax sp. TaxID=1872427 RepID=UPI003BA9278E
MKKIMIALLMAPALSLAAEQLPDSAPRTMMRRKPASRFPPAAGWQGAGGHVSGVPPELDTSDESRGMNAVSPDTRYLEDEQQELRQRQAESVRPPALRDNTPPPPPPTLIPIREL